MDAARRDSLGQLGGLRRARKASRDDFDGLPVDGSGQRQSTRAAEAKRYFGDPDALERTVESTFARTRSEAGVVSDLQIVEWFVGCPVLILTLLLGIFMIFALVAILPWAMGDPMAQMSDPANFFLAT